VIASVRGKILTRGPTTSSSRPPASATRSSCPGIRPGTSAAPHAPGRARGRAFLFGFETREELALFELIIGVSGVGPRAALAILSVARPADVAAAIAAGDAATLAKAPGVGKKTAERLIVDLRSKVGRLAVGPVAGELASPDEAIAALRALGYTLAEAEQALRGVPPPGKASTEERLATALRGR